MKRLNYIRLLCAVIISVGFVACNDDNVTISQSTPINVKQIYLEDYKSIVPDRPVDFARLGQLIRIEGEGFLGLKKLYINGYDTYFNVAYITNQSMLVNIHSKTPVVDAEDDVRNIIRFVKDKTETSYSFIIRSASPTISSVSNTLPQAGEKVFVYGNGLHETSSVTLPDGSIVSEVESDEDGEWYSFIMPSGITAGGSVYSEGANGIAATPAYFNYTDCMILDFDGKGDQGYWSWSETGSMINADDLVDDPANTGRGKCVPIIPERLIKSGGIAAGKTRATECWTAGTGNELDDWSRMYGYIPANTPLTDVAIQFDVYVPEIWVGSGHIQICLFNNFNYAGIGSDDDADNKQAAFYVPWIENGATVSFMTTGWQTVTIPFSQMGKYAAAIADKEVTDPTFQTVVDDRNAATYKNFGMGFVNTDFTLEGVEVTAVTCAPRIYLDNWRVVPCSSISISDFNDDVTE